MKLPAALFLFILLPSSFILSGCASPYRGQVRWSLLTWYAPRITVYADGGGTNRVDAAAPRASGDGQTVAARLRGPLVIFDNQLQIYDGGGSAASNSVLSGIEIPLK